MLNSLHLSNTNRPIEEIRYWRDEGSLDLNPPYQRGVVWGSKRKRNLIKSILIGIPIPSLVVNNRFDAGWDDWSYAVIDGKQRITAILEFLDSKLEIPGEWCGMYGSIKYSDLPRPKQLGLRNRPIAVAEGTLKTLEDEKLVFDLINFGGLSQGEQDND